MKDQSQHTTPNRTVKLVFEEVDTEYEDVKALKIFIDAPNRELDEKWVQCDDPTLAEVWATEVMAFVEQYMHRQMMETDANGFMIRAPKKKDMN